jgi:sec-independent protein translocase protein TatC
MSGPGAEMPFLDHLEELRVRLLRSLIALAVGFGVGFYLVQRFQLVGIISRPIQPYLGAAGKLTVLTPTEPVMIVFKLSFVVGLVLAAPIVLWQVWAFLAPALYLKERRVIVPALFTGSGLFVLGAVLAWFFVVPQSLRVLFSFQTDALQPMITYDGYFSFLIQVLIALGISFELPLLIFVLAWMGVATPARLNKFRRFAIVLSAIAGAILSPGTDLISMVMFTIPLLVLYEIGFFGSVLISRRRARKAAITAVVLLLALGGRRAEAQDVPKRPPPRAAADTAAADSARQDTTRIEGNAAPQQAADSVLESLLRRPGFTTIQYQADSASFTAEDRRLELNGTARAEREGTSLAAGHIAYDQAECLLTASGKPALTQGDSTVVGESVRYDTCRKRGVVRGGETKFTEGGTTWFIRGNVQKESGAKQLFAGASEVTSCALPTPHYHFAARRIKWSSGDVLVARPVVLYIYDIPILWLPFIFQDTRPGRHSGILVPKVGINDIVRTSRTYNRQITNIGYYWAPNPYMDFTARLDWYSGRYLQAGVAGQYNILNRYMSGSFDVNRQFESGGGSGFGVRWAHAQRFNISTRLNFDINYLSNTQIVDRNALDPVLNTQQITSSVNFTKQFGWGSLALGGNRRQSLSDSTSTTQLPSLTISPKPLDLGRNITWSPGLSLVRTEDRNRPLAPLLLLRPDGTTDTVAQLANNRVTSLNFDTPLRVGSFTWRNSLSMQDTRLSGRQVDSLRQPDLSTPDPNDSVTVYRTAGGDFQTGLNWDTGINLPLLFRSTWKLQPSIGITNASTQSPFFGVRNRATGGAWIFQGKRLLFSASLSPTFFFLSRGGIGPVARFRHSFSPLIRWDYAPAADVPEAFARAVTPLGGTPVLRSDARNTVTVSLNQNLEGKKRMPAGDSLDTSAPKFRLLSISTSGVTYDFEQAKQPGRTGWVTQSVTNTILSDLLPSFSLSVTHNLWRGLAGVDTSHFDPFLQSVSANFSFTGGSIRSLGSSFGVGNSLRPGQMDPAGQSLYRPTSTTGGLFGPATQSPGAFYSNDQIPMGGGQTFSANLAYTLTRQRRTSDLPEEIKTSQQNLNFGAMFSPTPLWAVSWQAQYNITEKRFESHVVRLERDLHDWRAAFNFVRNANGNVAVYFSIYLINLPELKLDFNQSTLGQ